MGKKLCRIAFFDGMIVFADTASERVPPKEILLLKYGKNKFTKDGKRGEFDFTPKDADEVLSDFVTRGKELVIDYEHQTLSGEKAPAAGWISKLEKTAEGLKGIVNYWTDEATSFLKTGAYRYFSPVCQFSRTGKSVSALHSLALTNHPALHSIPALVADDLAGDVEELDDDSNKNSKTKEIRMDKLLVLLGLAIAFADKTDEDKSKAVFDEVTKLLNGRKDVEAFLKLHDVDSLDKVTGKIQGMVPAADKLKLEDALKQRDAEAAVAVAMTDGKVTEAAKPWAIGFAKKDLEAFKDWCKGAPKVVPDNKDTDQGQGGGSKPKVKSFSDAEKKILRNMGFTDKDIEDEEKKGVK